jgi:hypothetical protein
MFPPQRLLAAASCLAALIVTPAVAAPCGGFTDLEDTDPFCGQVQWLKNREITLGCTATTYCPHDFVIRKQMAAFLNRLSNALTPIYLSGRVQWAAVNGNLTPGIVTCATNAYTPTFASRARGIAAIHAVSATAAPADVGVQFLVSNDNGASYAVASDPAFVTANGSAQTGRITTAAVLLPPVDLAVGTSYRWALRIQRPAGSATTADATGHCHVQVLLENRNPASAPFDDGAD